MTKTVTPARPVQQPAAEFPLTIERHVKQARKEMGPQKWAALNAEWPA